MKITISQLRELIREEIIRLNEKNDLKPKSFRNDLKNSRAEKAVLNGLSSVFGKGNVEWVHSGTDLTWTKEEDQGECYGLDDVNSHIYLEDKDGEFYIGVTGWSKWVMKPFKVSPNSITSTTVKLANKFKSQLTSL